jgi:hypothetical protein
MTKKTKMILGGVAVLGVAYYLYKRSQDGGMASMSGYSNMDGVRMSRFANMSGTPMGVSMSRFANASGLSMSPFAGSTARRRVCTRMEKDGSSTTYTAFGGRCPYGGTITN